LGAKTGAEKVTLTVNQLPSHGHPIRATQSAANERNPVGRVAAQAPLADLWSTRSQDVNMASDSISHVGGSRSHTNEMPYLCVNFIIALVGIYPSRH
jgi:microcystin-dependent protein